MDGIHKLLANLRDKYSQREIAEALGVTTRTLRRWEARQVEPPTFLIEALRQLLVRSDAVTPVNKHAFKHSGNWTREQLLLAFHFYCQTPFGKLHSKNKSVIDLAARIGRTPSALAMKCVNFASLDPTIRDSGRRGLGNTSAMDKHIWVEFHADWEGLVEECSTLLSQLQGSANQEVDNALEEDTASADFTGEVRTSLVKQRVKQSFFRKSVLSSYGHTCCISGVSDHRFLVASHIVAWKDDATIRLHPGNGLCLSALHDKAFDKHLFSLTDDYRIVLSKQLRRTKDHLLKEVFLPTEDMQITLPEKFVPEQSFIARHRHIMLSED